VLYYGDAESHLNIARRLIDSRTPGYDQIGTVWLPLPHALMLPFVGNDTLWRSGLAGTIPSAACFVLASILLFLAVRSIFQSAAAGAVSALVFALNPNLLYLQSTPMTEAVFFASVMGVLWCTVKFGARGSGRWPYAAAVGAGLFSAAACLTRYEGWFLLPFVAVYFLVRSGEKRIATTAVYCVLAVAVPLYWLAHNWWYYDDALFFFNAPYAPRGIAGPAGYHGYRDWFKAWQYFWAAARLCAGPAVMVLGVAGAFAALAKRIIWPVLFLSLLPAFLLLSIYASGGTPIHVPHLPPNTYYNTRYGLAAFPLLALGAGALLAWLPVRFSTAAAAAVVVTAVSPWLIHPGTDAWICWKESQVNSVARRAWTRDAAEFMRRNYRPGDGVVAHFGDLSGIFRTAGIPLRTTLHDGNNPLADAVQARPDLFLNEEWIVTMSNDWVSDVLLRLQKIQKDGNALQIPEYWCVRIFSTGGGPCVEIYRRSRSGPHP
jgi:hypothetical protein